MGYAGRYDRIHGKMKKRSGIKVREPRFRATKRVDQDRAKLFAGERKSLYARMKTFSAMRPCSSWPFARSSNASTLSSREKRCVISFSMDGSLPDDKSASASGYVFAYRKDPRMSTSRVAAAEMGRVTLHEPMPIRRTLPPAMHAY